MRKTLHASIGGSSEPKSPPNNKSISQNQKPSSPHPHNSPPMPPPPPSAEGSAQGFAPPRALCTWGLLNSHAKLWPQVLPFGPVVFVICTPFSRATKVAPQSLKPEPRKFWVFPKCTMLPPVPSPGEILMLPTILLRADGVTIPLCTAVLMSC